MSGLAIQYHQLENTLKELTPLKAEPSNRHVEERTHTIDVNHYGWVEQFHKLIQVERKIDLRHFNQETIQKVQESFNRFLDSMIRFGFAVNKNLAWQDSKPIHEAAREGCLLTLNALIQQGADVNAYAQEKTWGDTALHAAASANQVAAAELLIKNGANVNKPKDTTSLLLPLHEATSPEMCALLVRSGCSVNARSNQIFQESALHFNARCGRPDTLLTLLKLGAKDYRHLTAGSALEVAERVHSGTYSLLRSPNRNPVATRLSIDLLSHPDLAVQLFPTQKF